MGRCVAQATDQTNQGRERVGCRFGKAMRASISHSVATRERRSANRTDKHKGEQGGRELGELEERERGVGLRSEEEKGCQAGCLRWDDASRGLLAGMQSV